MLSSGSSTLWKPTRQHDRHGRRATRAGSLTARLWQDQRASTWVGAAVISAILMLGGSRTDATAPYAAIFFLGAGLLALVLGQNGCAAFRRLPAAVSGVLAALFALPVIQLVPLPAGWGQDAQGLQTATAIRALAGQGSAWLPLTLTPQTTVQLILSLVVLLGVFLAVVLADARGVRLIVGAILAVEMLSIVIGVLQLTSGGRLFNFYNSSHRFNLIGFFVNRNHTAVFLACMIPLALGFLTGGRNPPRALFAATGAIASAVLVAVVGTVSRAGIVLTVASFLLTLALMVPFPAGRRRLTVAALAGGTGVFGVLLFASTTVSRVFDRYADVGDDLRWRYYARTLALIPKFFPWGGGFGSFVPIYTANEPLGDVKPTYVNNAHNDFIEIVLEAGFPGGILALAVVLLTAWAGWRIIRMAPSPERSMALAGLIVMILFLAHSMVDYPLRRMACAALFSVALALVVRPLTRQPASLGEHA